MANSSHELVQKNDTDMTGTEEDYFLFRPMCHTGSTHSLLFVGKSEVTGSTGSHWVDTAAVFFSPISKSQQDSKVLYREKRPFVPRSAFNLQSQIFLMCLKRDAVFFALCVVGNRQVHRLAIVLILFPGFHVFCPGLWSPQPLMMSLK